VLGDLCRNRQADSVAAAIEAGLEVGVGLWF
jgi:hypothetical protein